MELLIQQQMSLADINKSFQKHFPFLKLKFYCTEDVTTPRRYASEPFDSTVSMARQIKNTLPSVIKFNPTDTTEEFEQVFKKKLGLHVRVVRKHNEDWVDTKQTKFLNLKSQNSLGSLQTHEHYNDYTLFL